MCSATSRAAGPKNMPGAKTSPKHRKTTQKTTALQPRVCTHKLQPSRENARNPIPHKISVRSLLSRTRHFMLFATCLITVSTMYTSPWTSRLDLGIHVVTPAHVQGRYLQKKKQSVCASTRARSLPPQKNKVSTPAHVQGRYDLWPLKQSSRCFLPRSQFCSVY